MHALPAYLNGVGRSSPGRGGRDGPLDVLNVLMRSGSLVREARSSSQHELQRGELQHPSRNSKSR
jgi:hypothetical protein